MSFNMNEECTNIWACVKDDFHDDHNVDNYDCCVFIAGCTEKGAVMKGFAFSSHNTQLEDSGWTLDLARNSAEESANAIFKEIGPFYIVLAFNDVTGDNLPIDLIKGGTDTLIELSENWKKRYSVCFPYMEKLKM